MMLVRPNNSQSVNELAAALDLSAWHSLRSSLVTGKAMIRMPRFTLDFRKALKDDLTALGLVRAFVPFVAEFPRIPTAPVELFISRVQHRAAVEVNEAGTTAAAATTVGVGITSAPPTLNFDQPFLFAIYERISGTILFVGKVMDPRG
jgi:serpin B